MNKPKPAMIDAVAPTDRIRRAYNLNSYVYGWLAAPFERKPRRLGLDRANIQPHDKVLEVAVGPGETFLDILKLVDRANIVCGIDLSPKMLAKTRRRIAKAGYNNFDLREADARQIPFADETFDVLYNSYMLDLIPLADLPTVLGEFKRVLKPGGRLVLVNMSKPDGQKRTWWEWLYQHTPRSWVPYLLGGCRPVLAAELLQETGFVNVQREYRPGILPTEIVTANKADRV